jgi:hypothetical protein
MHACIHYIVLHCIALRCIALHYIHYITLLHTYSILYILYIVCIVYTYDLIISRIKTNIIMLPTWSANMWFFVSFDRWKRQVQPLKSSWRATDWVVAPLAAGFLTNGLVRIVKILILLKASLVNHAKEVPLGFLTAVQLNMRISYVPWSWPSGNHT